VDTRSWHRCRRRRSSGAAAAVTVADRGAALVRGGAALGRGAALGGAALGGDGGSAGGCSAAELPAFDDLVLVTSARAGNFKDVLVE
jgi:hypothetical protein